MADSYQAIFQNLWPRKGCLDFDSGADSVTFFGHMKYCMSIAQDSSLRSKWSLESCGGSPVIPGTKIRLVEVVGGVMSQAVSGRLTTFSCPGSINKCV